MAFSKAHLYPPHLNLPAFYAKALSHPERIAILLLLNKRCELTAGELVKASMLSSPVVSQHLAILRRTGLVNYREEPPNVIYFLARKECDYAQMQIAKVFLAIGKKSG